MSDHEGKHIVVTGAARGIGAEVARRFLESGADVTVSTRDVPPYAHPRLLAVQTDVSTEDGSSEFAHRVLERHDGKVDVLVHNLGGSGGIRGPVLELTDEQWLTTLRVNLLVATRLDRLLVPAMRAGSSGCIVHISSIVRRHPLPDMLPYAVAKAALVTYSRGLALALAEDGVRVCSISPGFVDTEAFRAHRDRTAAASAPASVGPPPEAGNAIPLGRIGTPTDIADLILFLASERAGWVTGCDFVVDGGSVGSL
jgi:NAD(P)-dependent dehydrogenase (short-subunit alcohol dehydrogenase family)